MVVGKVPKNLQAQFQKCFVNMHLNQIFDLLIQESMLKFLDNRNHEKPIKTSINFKPEMIYGISAEAPSEFQTPHTIIHQNTYVNPYLEFEKKRSSCLPREKAKFVSPDWANKVNLQLVEEQKIVSSTEEKNQPSQFHSKFKKSYYDEYNSSENRFKKTRGEFTDFIQKNNHYKSVGPLHGQERTTQRIQQTKKSVWLKPDISQTNTTCEKKNSLTYTTYFDIKRENTMNQNSIGRNLTTVSSNSKMLTEKTRIRDNRKKINNEFRNGIEERKKNSLYHFELPKIQSDMDLSYEYFKRKILPNYGRPETADELKDLQSFEKSLRKKFR